MQPLPDVRGSARPYWSAALRGELQLPFCDSCRRAIFYPRDFCPLCGARSVTWRRCSGRGTVYSFSVVHTHPNPAFKQRAPYVVGLVTLEEGARLMTEIVDCPRDAVRVGMAVTVDFRRLSEEVALPVFKPA
jgi:uncharacterized OB-fold protein